MPKKFNVVFTNQATGEKSILTGLVTYAEAVAKAEHLKAPVDKVTIMEFDERGIFMRECDLELTAENLNAIKKEKERLSFLSKFSSEELIGEVYKRKDIFISEWYTKDRLPELIDIHEPYIDCFLRMKSGERSEMLNDIWEQWKKDLEQELGDVIEQWTDRYPYAFHIDLEYSQELGFYATYNGDPTDEMYETFRPHQGNLKTHIEDELQEVINKYLEENYF